MLTFTTLIAGAAFATAAFAALAAPPLAAKAASPAFADPLDVPARPSARAVRSSVTGLARVDDKTLVAVGPRGHVLRSVDAGATWQQAETPVSTDLVAVAFPTPALGWAVGHDGAVLRSRDGGARWERVLDGRTLGPLLVTYYERLAGANPGDSKLARALGEARRMAEEGPNKPFLSVGFRNAEEGWLVGSFNLMLYTRDGGAHWAPWLDRTDNPDGYSLHSVRAVGRDVYVAGELGLLLRLAEGESRFRRLTAPYAGSWFGLAGIDRTLVAFGLRGNAWRSDDAGQTWKQLETGTTSAINDGAFLPDKRLVLVSNRGDLLLADGAGTLRGVPLKVRPAAAFAVLPLTADELVLGTPAGPLKIAVPPAQP